MPEHDPSKGKPIPRFNTDEEAEHFIETADLSEYDLSGFRPANFVIHDKSARVNMRMPRSLFNSLKIAAIEEQIPYQRLMRDLLAQGLEARAEARKPVRKKAS
jgi:predicted DNA binding CopG/RHH family protein